MFTGSVTSSGVARLIVPVTPKQMFVPPADASTANPARRLPVPLSAVDVTV
jgi:hypothetical protein